MGTYQHVDLTLPGLSCSRHPGRPSQWTHFSLRFHYLPWKKKKKIYTKLHQWLTQPWQLLARQLCELLFRVHNGLVIVFMALWWSAKHCVALCTASSWRPWSPRSQCLVKGIGPGPPILSHQLHHHQLQHPSPMSRDSDEGPQGQSMTSWVSFLRYPEPNKSFFKIPRILSQLTMLLLYVWWVYHH